MQKTVRIKYCLFLFGVSVAFFSGRSCFSGQSDAFHKYTFKYWGEFRPTIYSLSGESEPQPGDVIGIDSLVSDGPIKLKWLLVLEEPGTYDFIDKFAENGCIYRVNKDGSKYVIGVAIGTFHDIDDVVRHFSPLDKMTPEQIKKIRGVAILEGGQKHLQKLKYLDADKTCFTIENQFVSKTWKDFSEKIRFMHVPDSNWLNNQVRSGAKFRNLKLLVIDCLNSNINESTCKSFTSLLYFEAPGSFDEKKSFDINGLKHLKKLNTLRIPGISNLKDVSFISPCNNLKYLDISGSSIKDLRPLSGLANLKKIQADYSPIEYLPSGQMNSLEQIWVIGTKLKLQDIEAFERKHKKCIVANQINRILERFLIDVTLIEIDQRDHERCSCQGIAFVPWKVDANAKSIHEFVKNFRVDPSETELGYSEPSYQFIFYTDKHGKISFELADELLDGRISLTRASALYVANYLVKLGDANMLENIKKNDANRVKFDEDIKTIGEHLPVGLQKEYFEKLKNLKLKWTRNRAKTMCTWYSEETDLAKMIIEVASKSIRNESQRVEIYISIINEMKTRESFYLGVISDILAKSLNGSNKAKISEL